MPVLVIHCWVNEVSECLLLIDNIHQMNLELDKLIVWLTQLQDYFYNAYKATTLV